ncbi:MAG: hypothetical protein IPP33_15745, partial [Flavobacteriales bacterium]|nr:hypothetical protein [Flavobacteriales bacterium]
PVHCTEDGEPIGLLHVGPGDLGSIDVLATWDNGVVLLGSFDSTVDLGGGQILSGNDDAFIAKYSEITGIQSFRASAPSIAHLRQPQRWQLHGRSA